MRDRVTVTLFPFLSVLVSAMGVLSFLAVTFLLFVRQDQALPVEKKPVQVSWVGAPEHVRPLLVECRDDGVIFHRRRNGTTRSYSVQALEKEVEIVKELEQRSIDQLGPAPDPYRLWLYLKNAIQAEPRLSRSFTKAIHSLELYNLTGEGRRSFIQFYPILLVFPTGVRTYELAAYLVETTTRLPVGLEPLLEGWELPYGEHTSQAPPAGKGKPALAEGSSADGARGFGARRFGEEGFLPRTQYFSPVSSPVFSSKGGRTNGA